MPLNLDLLTEAEQKAVKRRIAFWLQGKIERAQERFDTTQIQVYEGLKREMEF